jgi:hypothetical protein
MKSPTPSARNVRQAPALAAASVMTLAASPLVVKGMLSASRKPGSCTTSMTYLSVVMGLSVIPARKAMARTVVVTLTVMGPVKSVPSVGEGALPSVVKRMEAPAVVLVMFTVTAVGKVPPAGVSTGAATCPPPLAAASTRASAERVNPLAEGFWPVTDSRTTWLPCLAKVTLAKGSTRKALPVENWSTVPTSAPSTRASRMPRLGPAR